MEICFRTENFALFCKASCLAGHKPKQRKKSVHNIILLENCRFGIRLVLIVALYFHGKYWKFIVQTLWQVCLQLKLQGTCGSVLRNQKLILNYILFITTIVLYDAYVSILWKFTLLLKKLPSSCVQLYKNILFKFNVSI